MSEKTNKLNKEISRRGFLSDLVKGVAKTAVAVTGIALVAEELAGCGAGTYGSGYNADGTINQNYVRKVQQRLLQELGYLHEGLQTDNKVVRIGVIRDPSWERTDKNQLKEIVEQQYQAESGARTTGHTEFFADKQEPRVFAAVYPLTSDEAEQMRVSRMAPEQRREYTCTKAYNAANANCDSSPEGRTMRACKAERDEVTSRIYLYANRMKGEHCGIDHPMSMGERNACIDRVLNTYGENGTIAREAKSKYQACVKPVETVYRACVDTTKRALQMCMGR
ncbi:MAG: hypothetical protein ABIG89_06635 [Candidatus Woesearchaeota archaeon]